MDDRRTEEKVFYEKLRGTTRPGITLDEKKRRYEKRKRRCSKLNVYELGKSRGKSNGPIIVSNTDEGTDDSATAKAKNYFLYNEVSLELSRYAYFYFPTAARVDTTVMPQPFPPAHDFDIALLVIRYEDAENWRTADVGRIDRGPDGSVFFGAIYRFQKDAIGDRRNGEKDKEREREREQRVSDFSTIFRGNGVSPCPFETKGWKRAMSELGVTNKSGRDSRDGDEEEERWLLSANS
uniref:Uncharacterized protein n=1 Tax=Vespula pensylvanica TaxID=30213 RepID=A0A834P3T1_VESPE|nr:hypothetical protein H0235_006545 [Vespula pensylvanica]